MNILIICERENNPFIGGIEHVDYSLTREWLKAGNNVLWLSVRNSGAKIPYTPLVDEYFLPDGNQADASNNVGFLFFLIEKYQIQIIVNQATIRKDVVSLCNEAKTKLNVKLVSCFHFAPNVEYDIAKNNIFLFKDGFSVKAFVWNCYLFFSFYLYRGNKLKKNEKHVIRAITSSSDMVVVLSNRYISDLEKISGYRNFQMMRNAMDYVRMDSLPKKDKKVLYCAARLEYGMKRFDRMLRIWQKIEPIHKDWDLIVIGDGDYKPRFMDMAQQMRLSHIKFLGLSDPKSYYESSSVLCLTSTKEGAPMVIVEAMQYGCVPIAYDSFAALADVVDNGVTGYRIPAFNQSEYVEKLSQVMSDANLRNRMAENCMKIPEAFNSEIIAPKWLEMFEGMV